MKRYSLIILMLAIFFTSCEDFLSEPPSKTSSLVPSTTEHLEALLNNYGTYDREGNSDVIFGSDDYGLVPEIYDDNPSLYDIVTAQYATWDVESTPDDDRPYWPSEWAKIFNANLILLNLDNVEGTESD